MIPQVSQHVKCFLRNATVLEGIVENWTDTRVVLKSLDGQTLLIIHDPGQDILITKIFLLSPENIAEQSSQTIPDIIEENICQIEDDASEDPIALRAKSVAELRVELAKQEREILAGQLKEHYPNSPRKITYGYPQLPKKPRTQ